jgi:hypothetical protein
MDRRVAPKIVVLGTLVMLTAARATQADDRDLAKKSQNPIANLVSVPMQFNFNGGIGAYDRTQLLLNVQPVIPIPVTDNVNVLTRWIMPVLETPDAGQPQGSTWGLGDFNPQVYLSLTLPHDLTVGLGVNSVLPTATDSVLGWGQFLLGPSGVVVWSPGALVAGFVVNQSWTVTGNSSRPDVSFFLLQPFVNVNLPEGLFLVSAPIITSTWQQNGWTVPIGGGVGRLMKIGMPMSLSFQAYWNVETPTNGAAWQVRAQVALLFPQPPPKKKK